MKPQTAPIIVGTIGVILGILVGEPAASLLAIAIAILGYSINKKAN